MNFKYCKKINLDYGEIQSNDYYGFLTQTSDHQDKKFIGGRHAKRTKIL